MAEKNKKDVKPKKELSGCPDCGGIRIQQPLSTKRTGNNKKKNKQ